MIGQLYHCLQQSQYYDELWLSWRRLRHRELWSLMGTLPRAQTWLSPISTTAKGAPCPSEVK
ncbi:hypothetical protein [Streptomyces sp. NPDC005131]